MFSAVLRRVVVGHGSSLLHHRVDLGRTRVTGIVVVALSRWDVVLRLGASLGFGAVIGFERERDGHAAGTRTYALLTLGSALFGVLSVGAFDRYVTTSRDSNVTIDVSRIASYLVAGVGFLAGGAIVKHSNHVKGLTTAAAMWVAAAVGLAAGLGFYIGAICGTAATLVMLLIERPVRHLTRKSERVSLRVVTRTRTAAQDVLRLAPDAQASSLTARDDGSIELQIEGLQRVALDRITDELLCRDDIVELAIGESSR